MKGRPPARTRRTETRLHQLHAFHTVGADDLDGTVIEEKIYHDAGATTPQGMTRKELCRLITEAGRVPVERDTLYHAVTRSEDSFTVAV